MPLEYLVRDSDNEIKLTLTEDNVAIIGSWTELDIWIENLVQIHRTSDSDGVTLNTSTGVLIIKPADLTAGEITDIAALSTLKLYRVRIVVKSATNDDGAVWGDGGSDTILFRISDKPS